jgi:hypothetical protein
MAESKIKAELSRLANSPFVGNISKQISVYETRVKRLVSDFDSRSRNARERSKRHLDQLSTQLKKTRGDVEKRITTLWKHEGTRLNKSVNELVTYIKAMTKKEAAAAGTKKRAKKTGTKKTTTKRTTRKTATANA